MADVKISALPASTTPLAGTEVLPIVQGGITKQVSIANVTAGRDVTINTLTAGLGGGAVSTSTAFGYQALNATVTGTNNLAIGYQAGKAITSGASNIAIGSSALITNSGGNANICIGNGAGYNTTGSNNLAIGSGSLNQNSTSSGSVAIGTSALNQSTGASNTAIGVQAGYGNASANANTTGTNNTFIGYQTVGSANSNTNAIVVGYQAIGLGSNTTVIGNSSTTATYNGNNSATWSIVSDARVKKNVESLKSGFDVISALRPVEFDYIENDKHDVGFIAQEYQVVLPAQIIEQDNKMLGLNQNLIPYLVKALQELNEKFDAYVASHP